ncbi:MAG: hypothetical protein KAR42_02770 [candidate division Zixibacteria bacterium]|nr:hypothetical protein [candidate division Zixibacteria bacterium]
MRRFLKMPSAIDIAENLAQIQRIPNCEDCELLRGANLLAAKVFGKKHTELFNRNLAGIITTHVDLNCKECPVDEIVKKIRKDRLAAIAALF